jgi:hypothetical protein
MDTNLAIVETSMILDEEIVLELPDALTPLTSFMTPDGVILNEETWNQLLEGAASREDDVKLRRLKLATEAYREHKALYADELTEERFQGYMSWPTYRDQFLVDRELNYRLVDEQEADVIFETAAETALAEINTDVNTLAEQAEAASGTTFLPASTNVVLEVETANDLPKGELLIAVPGLTDAAAPVAQKRRGRPPGSGKKSGIVKNKAPAAPKAKRGRPAGTAKKKVAAKKKSAVVTKGESKADQAREIIKTWAGKGWARKDIIAKLMDRLDMTAATASTYYQNYK